MIAPSEPGVKPLDIGPSAAGHTNAHQFERPLYLRERTQLGHRGMSQMCQSRHFAVATVVNKKTARKAASTIQT